jgi:hypothetical protein
VKTPFNDRTKIQQSGMVQQKFNDLNTAQCATHLIILCFCSQQREHNQCGWNTRTFLYYYVNSVLHVVYCAPIFFHGKLNIAYDVHM